MLNFNFVNALFLAPFINIFIFIWFFFVKNNFYYVRISPGSQDVLKNSNFLKKLNYSFFLNFFIFLFFYFFIFLFVSKYDFILTWFLHLKLNNFLINLIFLVFLINIFLLNIIKYYKNKNINFNIDYFFALFNICLFIPIMYLSNTVFTFIFLLEIISILILYKFSVSKYFFNSSKNNEKNVFLKNTPKFFVNMVFFQYWVSFFSSVILFFSIFNILLLLGTSDWFIINILNKTSSFFKENYIYMFVYMVFIIGMFFKIGFTPTHFFKIEVYKGLPLISILFYTVFYFMSFFIYFVLIIFYYNNSFKFLIWFFLYIFITLGLIYIISLFFDINLIKNFFAYSTIINALTFIILVFVSLS